MIERQIEIKTPDGSMTTFEFHPEEDGPYPIVLYLMDAPSIRPALKDMASRLASAGYYVLLPFLYYRKTPYREFGLSDEDMHVRREYMMAVNRDCIIIDTQAMLEYTRNNDKADSSGQIGAVGFCMSGPLVMGLLQRMPEKVAAVASIHGAWLVSDQDDSPHKEIDQIKGEVYFGWADNDPTATREELEIMDKALADQGVNYRIEFMEGALHGFAPPGGERYHRTASEKHWERVHDLFRRNLDRG
ncbi:MAG: dienelactone hydrolase family protein [Pseudomonadales bacterium]|jgi:carboxymethylenebutenolidase|nr:dienelactone hydrolase family protein [Pseudomonadales bacterium]